MEIVGIGYWQLSDLDSVKQCKCIGDIGPLFEVMDEVRENSWIELVIDFRGMFLCFLIVL